MKGVSVRMSIDFLDNRSSFGLHTWRVYCWRPKEAQCRFRNERNILGNSLFPNSTTVVMYSHLIIYLFYFTANQLLYTSV